MKTKILLFLVFVVFLVSPFKGRAQAANVQDSLALVDLYNSAGGPGWSNHQNWLTAPVKNWFGVTLDTAGRVTNISLASNGLRGVLPQRLTTLAKLQQLTLQHNYLTLNGLELVAPYYNFAVYAPQDTILPVRLNRTKFSASAGGTVTKNTYKWYNGSTLVKTVTGDSTFTPIAIGNYQVKVTNTQATALTLYSDTFALAAVPPATLDSLVLVALYDSTNGADWANRSNWLTSAPLSSWYGVTVDSTGRATGLDLNTSNLHGTIPAQLGSLANLKILNLSANKFSGSMPAQLGNLANLQGLDLSSSGLSGSIPAQLGNLASLQTLTLSYNQLSNSIPVQLGSLANLKGLYLINNQLSGSIPAQLGTLANLQELDLNNNQLSGSIPAQLGGLANLQALDFSYNQLSGSIPAQLGNLVSIKDLYLQNNQISGNIPAQLGSLANLQDLRLQNNKLSGNIPAQLGTHTNLGWLDLSHNQLSGSIPPEFGSLSFLSVLLLNNNQLSGSIPAQLSYPVLMSILDVSNNQLSSRIPAELANLNNLTMWLFGNYFNFDGMETLVQKFGFDIYASPQNALPLHVNKNVLSVSAGGTLYYNTYDWYKNGVLLASVKHDSTYSPVDSGSYAVLVSNDIVSAQNSLTLNSNTVVLSQLPANVQDSLALVALYDSANGAGWKNQNGWLAGPVQTWYGIKLDVGGRVISISLDSNQLTGIIPTQLGSLANLKKLSLKNNQLSGGIPEQLGNLTKLESIDISYNRLVGGLPPNFFDLVSSFFPVLQWIWANNNYLNFDGMEYLGDYAMGGFAATPQYAMPLHDTNGQLHVYAGGQLTRNTYQWFNYATPVETTNGDSTYSPVTRGRYSVAVNNSAVTSATGLTLYSDTLTVNTSDSAILPARPNTESASYEYTDSAGWTHYYFNNNTPNDLTDDTLLLSLKKNGQNIGTIGDGTFGVKLVATAAAGSNAAVKLTNPLITNSSGYWVMNRYWQVTPTHEPTGSVGVRFYYNKQDLTDVNGSYPNHNLTNDKLIFYKTVGGNPDPTTNLAGATAIISIMPGTAATDTTWTYHALSDTTQYGQYSVASFSGGGGGGTGNNQALPVVLVNFTGNLAKNDVQLNWQTAQEINAGYYTVERSLTGRDYTAVGRINAAGNSSITQTYKLTDYNAALLGSTTLYYRLKISDKNGYTTYSNVIAVNIAGGVSGLLVYPNPAKNTATVIFSANAVGKYAVEITDGAGKTIKRIEGLSAAGTNRAIVDLQGYPQGAYMITLKGTNIKQQNITLLKQ